jgi:hypothetical protein
MKQLALEEEHKRLDEEAFISLFGTPSTFPKVETTTVGRVSDVNGESRRRYIQYYSNHRALTSKGGTRAQEPSLMDSLI